MNRKVFFFTCLALTLFVSPLVAQVRVKFPQADFSCSVKVTPHTTAPATAPQIKAIGIVRIGNIRCDSILRTDNSVSKVWSLVHENLSVIEITKQNGTKETYVLTGVMRDEFTPMLLRFTAGSVSWMTENTLLKEDAKEVVNMPLHYMAKMTQRGPVGSRASGTPEPLPTAFVFQAWIDPETLLPLKFDDGNALYELSFAKEPPTGTLVMPENMQAECKRWQNALTPRRHL